MGGLRVDKEKWVKRGNHRNQFLAFLRKHNFFSREYFQYLKAAYKSLLPVLQNKYVKNKLSRVVQLWNSSIHIKNAKERRLSLRWASTTQWDSFLKESMIELAYLFCKAKLPMVKTRTRLEFFALCLLNHLSKCLPFLRIWKHYLFRLNNLDSFTKLSFEWLFHPLIIL